MLTNSKHHNEQQIAVEVIKKTVMLTHCTQQCQRASWLTTHKYECQLFARLYPKVLPSNVRAVVQMLLLRETSKASQVEWNNFLGLQSHVEKWKSHNDETWDNITLMSKAAKEYSGTDVDRVVVQDIFCKVNSLKFSTCSNDSFAFYHLLRSFQLMINSFSLSSPSQYSIGFVLHPLLALTNHSCNYNAVVEFTWNGPGTNPLLLYAARPIAKDEEVLISYIDPGDNLTARRKALEDRYFFTCNCDRCSKEDDELQRK